MIKACCVCGCTTNAKNYPDFQFYVLPKYTERRNNWFSDIGRYKVNDEGKIMSTPWSTIGCETLVLNFRAKMMTKTPSRLKAIE